MYICVYTYIYIYTYVHTYYMYIGPLLTAHSTPRLRVLKGSGVRAA